MAANCPHMRPMNYVVSLEKRKESRDPSGQTSDKTSILGNQDLHGPTRPYWAIFGDMSD